MEDYLSFKLPDSFVSEFENKKVDWGFSIGGENSIGELTFLTKYSRLKPNGTKERWHEACRRVIEGMYSIQKNHIKSMRLPWNESQGQRSAKEAYARMFEFKWLPPGRGIEHMGSYVVNATNNSAPLQNCGFTSTEKISTHSIESAILPFVRLMDMSMVGIGVGFDTKGAGKLEIHKPLEEVVDYVIPDSREGWTDSYGALLESYFFANRPTINFIYDEIRPAGAPIKTFGGIAPGPEPLKDLHESVRQLFKNRQDTKITETDIVDLNNLAGRCVVSGGIRRTAEIALGDINSKEFLQLKDYEVNPERAGHGWASNNSVYAEVGDDYSHLIDNITENGEPGLFYLDLTRKYGRLADPANNKDWRVGGTNPSLVPGTKVYTTEGILPIEQLDGKTFYVRNLDGNISEAKCWQSGEDVETLTVRLVGGHEYGATPQHKWPVYKDGGWVRVRTDELQPGDKLPNLVTKSVFPLGTEGTYDEGFLIGWNLGDGWQTSRERGLQIGFIVSDEDKSHHIDTKIEKSLALLGSTANFDGKYEINVNNTELRDLFLKYGVQHKTQGLPLAVWDSSVSDEFRKGLVDGLFSSDGNVDDERIGLKQASEKLIRETAELLGFFGIKSQITKQETTGRKAFKGHNAYVNEDKVFTSFHLRIGGMENVANFSSVFSLSHARKQKAIETLCARIGVKGHDQSWYAQVSSIEERGTSDVWDITVYDTTHAFQVAFSITGNCSEQSLENNELCTLSECFPHRHESIEDFKRTLKFAYLYGKTVTLMPTPWPETNAIMQRNRRIGCSISGLVQFTELRDKGLSDLRKWMDEGYEEIVKWDEKYSEWLGIRESIKKTSVKPSGCRPWDALTSTDHGLLTLEEIFEMSGHKEGETWHDFEGLKALQGDQTSQISKTYDNGKEEVLSIKLAYGIELRSTPNHKWFVKSQYIRNKTHRYIERNEWVRADELTNEDILEIQPGVYDSKVEADLMELDSRAISMRSDAREIKQPKKMNPDLAWLLGYLWGDGAMSPMKYRIRFIDANEFNLEKAQRVLLEQFGIESNLHQASELRKAKTLEVGSKMLWHWLIKNNVWKYYAQGLDLIPKVVRASSQESIIAFLAGLIDADGCVTARATKQTIILASADKDFSRHVQDVALSVGLVLGRSHNTKGKNLQKQKSIWLMTMAPQTTNICLSTLVKHSNKMRIRDGELPWSNVGRGQLILGHVRSVESLGYQETFDIEVANTHWYYAGAVKSHNTVSLLAGATPGVHWPVHDVYIRRIRYQNDDPILQVVKEAGYHVEPDVADPKYTSVAEFPTQGPLVRTERDVSVWEKAQLAVLAQRYWADNQVSCTLTFSEEEKNQIHSLLRSLEGQIKSISLLPMVDGGSYAQMPYEAITEEAFDAKTAEVKKMNWSALYDGGELADADGDKFCSNDTCTL